MDVISLLSNHNIVVDDYSNSIVFYNAHDFTPNELLKKAGFLSISFIIGKTYEWGYAFRILQWCKINLEHGDYVFLNGEFYFSDPIDCFRCKFEVKYE